MLSTRARIELFAGALILAGIGLTLYKVFTLGFPLLPGEYRDVWTIESKISFRPAEGPVEIELKLPRERGGWEILDEHFASSGFGFTVREEDEDRWAVWTRSTLEEPTTLYYKLQAYRLHETGLPHTSARPPEPPLLEDDQLAAVRRLIETFQSRSSVPVSLSATAGAVFIVSGFVSPWSAESSFPHPARSINPSKKMDIFRPSLIPALTCDLENVLDLN